MLHATETGLGSGRVGVLRSRATLPTFSFMKWNELVDRYYKKTRLVIGCLLYSKKQVTTEFQPFCVHEITSHLLSTISGFERFLCSSLPRLFSFACLLICLFLATTGFTFFSI